MKDSKEKLYPFTNPDKVLYPGGITKLDVAEYYHAIKDWILPHAVKRPLTIVRCPQGQQEKCFYQKHLNEIEENDLYTIVIQEKSKKENYIYIKNECGLMALVQLAVLEIHDWGCHINHSATVLLVHSWQLLYHPG